MTYQSLDFAIVTVRNAVGGGEILLQDGKPVEYASKSFTKSEINWAQVEKEILAILSGLNRSRQ